MSNPPDVVSQLEQRLAAATTQFDTAQAALYRPDGKPIYVQDLHDEHVNTLREALKSEVSVVEQLLASEREVTERTLTQLNGGDVADSLTPEELGRANARALFIREDAERLPLVELLARVNAVAAGGDRALAFLWNRYASVRLKAEQQDQKTVRIRPESEALQALIPALRGLAGQVEGPDRAQQRERAAARLKQIERTRIAAFRERSSRVDPPKRGSMARL